MASGHPEAMVQAAILARADQVRKPGVYLGFFEWVVWGKIRGVAVQMLFGSDIKDIGATFAPAVSWVGVDEDDPLQAHTVAAVKLSEDKWLVPESRSGSDWDVNHFVIGIECDKAEGCNPSLGDRCAIRAAGEAGWALEPTDATGDCAVDCMAYFAGLHRNPESFGLIRVEIAGYMQTIADRPVWHQVWKICQENTPPEEGGAIVDAPKASSPGAPSQPAERAAEQASSPGALCQPPEKAAEEAWSLGALCQPADKNAEEASSLGAVCQPAQENAEKASSLVAVCQSAQEDVAEASSHNLSFIAWLATRDVDTLNRFTSSHAAYKQAEEEWLAKHQRVRKRVLNDSPRQRRNGTALRYRLATGLSFLRWRDSEEGRASKQVHVDFLRRHREYRTRTVPKKDRVWLAQCAKVAQEHNEQKGGFAPWHNRGSRPCLAETRVPDRCLVRRRLRQGPPYKCPVIREFLWDWFVDIRRSLATTISPRFVILKAKEIATKVLREMRRLNEFTEMPVIDKHWLRRWKRDKKVVFRKPNMRFKCSRPVLESRLRAMWLNTIRVRRLAEHTLGRDLADQIYGVDEKPIHMNESGSKNTRTLEIVGAPSVKLKENHAATRERVSLMTIVTSNPAVAKVASRLPIELLFKAPKGSKLTSKLTLRTDMSVSVQHSEKGSYRTKNILKWLSRWLEEWTDERRLAKDWRLLFMDVAKSHIDESVALFAWTRGYVVLLHYGCTTAVAQVNDTDLHGAFENEYVEREQEAFNQKQRFDPGNISRSRQEVVDDVCSTWVTLNHEQGVWGHKRTGLSVSLTGAEDNKITREAEEFWNSCQMPDERLRALKEVDEGVATGKLTWCWESIQNLIRQPESVGVMEEGQEFEGEIGSDELFWLTKEDEALLDKDDKAIDAPDDAEKKASCLVDALGGADDPKDVSEAEAARVRLDALRKLRALAAGEAKLPAAAFAADSEVKQIQRGRASGSKGAQATNKVLHRQMAALREKEGAQLQRKREETRKAKTQAAQAKALAAKDKAIKDAKAKEAKEKKALLDALPKEFTDEMCGQGQEKGGGKPFIDARAALLDKLKLRSPELPLECQVRWVKVRDAYVRKVGREQGANCGNTFVRRVKEIKELLGDFFGEDCSKEEKKKKKNGDPKAFEKFFLYMDKMIPHASTSVTL